MRARAGADGSYVGQRLCMLAAAVVGGALLATTAPGSTATTTPPDWAAKQIKTVVAHRLMSASTRSFHPNAALTRQALADLSSGLKQQLAPAPAQSAAPPPTTTGETTTGTTTTTTTDSTTTDATTTTAANGSSQATMADLDRQLVISLGLLHQAGQFSKGATAAGLTVPNRFGTEAVARLLGLRINHPAAQDYLELRPQDTATRAEAAYSAAQILSFGMLADSWQIGYAKQTSAAFTLPTLNLWQRRILDIAFSKIGMPYIWGGTGDGPEAPFGVPSRGGYDCSGFIWRVYKLQSYPGEGDLASRIQGRTTYTMSVEVPASERIPFAKLQPADVIFFGSEGPASSGAEIDHTAIYAGNGWFIQSSDQGVALAQLTGWYRKQFAWGRRPLREAGLEP